MKREIVRPRCRMCKNPNLTKIRRGTYKPRLIQKPKMVSVMGVDATRLVDISTFPHPYILNSAFQFLFP